MAEGRGRDRWSRASLLASVIANCHRDPKKGRAYKPADFDPFARAREETVEVNRENIGLLKEAFTAAKGVAP